MIQKFPLYLELLSSYYLTFLLYVKPFGFSVSTSCSLIFSSSTVGYIFTSLYPPKLLLPNSPVTLAKSNEYLFKIISFMSFSLLFSNPSLYPFYELQLLCPILKYQFSKNLFFIWLSFYFMCFVSNLVHMCKALVIACISYTLILTPFQIFLMIFNFLPNNCIWMCYRHI